MTKAKKKQIANEMIPVLKEMFGEGVEFRCTLRPMTNEVKVAICMLLPGATDLPVVNIEDMPENATLEERVNFAAARFQQILKGLAAGACGSLPEMPEITREYVLENVVLQALSRKRNRDMMAQVAHFEVLDMIGVFRIPVGGYRRNTLRSFLVENMLVETLDLSIPELREAACRNTVEKFGLELITRSQMLDFLSRGDDWRAVPFAKARMEEPGPCTLTNGIHINGAAGILIPEVLEAVAEKAGGDYYIMPSSIHEVMITKAREVDAGLLESMQDTLREGNRSLLVLGAEEVLTDNIYRYSHRDRTLTIA